MINLANFSSMFPFKSNTAALSPINTLLDSEDITLQRLLDEETFTNEFKIQNPKLIQFMKYDKYKLLIQFVTVVGPEQNHKRGYKYPFIACQALTAEHNGPAEFLLPEKQIFIEQEVVQQIDVEQQIQQIVDASKKQEKQNPNQNEIQDQLPPLEKFDEERNSKEPDASPKKKIIVKRIVKKSFTKKVKKAMPPLINYLFSYIDGEVNYTLAGYFSKILTILFNKKSVSLTNYFFTNKKYEKIVNHIQSRSIAEIIIKFLTIDSLQFLNERCELLDIILEKLSNSEEINMMGNLSFVLCDAIQKFASTIKTINGSKQLLAYIYSPTFCTKLVHNVISQDDIISIYNTPILLSSLTSIRNIMENKQQTKNTELLEKFQEILNFIKNNLAESSELTTLFKNLFIQALDKLNINRRSRQVFGFGRIKLIEVLFYLIRFDFFNIQKILIETPFFAKLFHVMKEYELNNVLHNQIIKILTFVFELEQGSPIINNLIQNGNLLNFLYEQVIEDQNIIQSNKTKKRLERKGYIGHIVKIGHLLLKVSGTNNQFSSIFLDDRWSAVKTFIDRQTHSNQKNLGGFATRKPDNSNMLFNKQDILSLYHTFLIQTPQTTYPEPVQQPKIEQLQETMKQFEKLQLKQKVITKEVKQVKPQNLPTKSTAQVKNTSEIQVPKIEPPTVLPPTIKTQVISKNTEQQQTKKKIEQQQLKQIEEGIELYEDVKYWKDSKNLQYQLDDLMKQLQ